MSLLRPARFLAALVLSLSAGLRAESVLFVGNSFTFTPRKIGVGTVTELNPDAPGGVPAVFQALAEIGGRHPTVSMETVGGKTLAFHYETKRELIDKSWDVVVLQDYSTGPLIQNGDSKSYESFRANVENLKAMFVARNPAVKIWLYQTWARPDLVMKGAFPSVEAMQEGLRHAYADAARDFSVNGPVPVGDAFLATVTQGLSDNPATPEIEGPMKTWGKDNYHQSTTGTYLAALLFYGALYGEDPRSLPADNAVARHLNLSAGDSSKLQALAEVQLQVLR